VTWAGWAVEPVRRRMFRTASGPSRALEPRPSEPSTRRSRVQQRRSRGSLRAPGVARRIPWNSSTRDLVAPRAASTARSAQRPCRRSSSSSTSRRSCHQRQRRTTSASDCALAETLPTHTLPDCVAYTDDRSTIVRFPRLRPPTSPQLAGSPTRRRQTRRSCHVRVVGAGQRHKCALRAALRADRRAARIPAAWPALSDYTRAHRRTPRGTTSPWRGADDRLERARPPLRICGRAA